MMIVENEFKISEIGEVPVNWEVEKLENISEFKNGYAFNAKKYTQSGKKIIRMGNISISGKLILNERNVRYCSTEEYNKLTEYHLNKNDLIICMTDITPGKLLVGRTAIIDKNNEYILNQRVGRIKIASDKVDNFYLYYFTNSEIFLNPMKEKASGSAQFNLSTIEIKNAYIAYPPLNEQQKIAKILSTVDEQIEQTDQLIEKTKELKKGLMQQLLTNGIGHTEFKQSDLGKIPVEWEVKMIPDLVSSEKNAIKIGPFGSQLKKELLVKSGYKVYGQENIIAKDFNKGGRFLTPEHFNKLKTSELKVGDFIITMMGTIGKCGIFPDNASPGIMDSHLLRIRLSKELYANELLLHVINSDLVQKQLKNLSVGGIMAGLSSKTIKKLLLPVPSIEEQKKIAFILTAVDEEIMDYQEEKLKIEELKKGLMQQLLTGKTRVKVD